MKYQGQKESSNIEDRTSQSSGFNTTSGIDLNNILGGINTPSSGASLFGGGLGTIVIMVILFLLFGGSGGSYGSANIGDGTTTSINYDDGGLGELLGLNDDAVDTTSQDYQDRKEYISVVMSYLEDFWSSEAEKEGFDYRTPTLVLYNGSTMTPGGIATKDMGPFYSPADEKIYLDLSFADELSQEYGVQGDYAMAYVLAHEFGHHIQTLLGVSDQVDQWSQALNQTQYNKLSVRLELQADYYAGMFTNYLGGQTFNGQPILDADDISDAMETAQAIGDDQLMKQATGYVNPDNFTHGTSEQRMAWFRAGVDYGDMEHGDTFNAPNLDKP